MRKVQLKATLLALLVTATGPLAVLAQTASATWFTTLLDGIAGVLETLLKVGVVLAFLVFVWGLVVFLAKGGDEKSITEGKQKMTWGVLALFVVLSIWGIIAALQLMFGVDEDMGTIAPPGIPA